jgi:hypothetical protein
MNRIALVLILFTACDGVTMNDDFSEDDGGIFGDQHLGRAQVGNTLIVPHGPIAGSAGPWMKILNATTADRNAIPVSINIRSEYTTDANGNPLNFASPLVGRVLWGTGGAYNVIEFDVPSPRVSLANHPLTNIPDQPVNDLGNGVMIQLAGAAFEVQVRNDAFLTPLASNGVVAGVIGPDATAKMMAFITPGGGHQVGALRRTLYIAAGEAPPNNVAAGQQVLLTIPLFAKRVWFPRIPSSNTPFLVETFDNINAPLRRIAVNVGSEAGIEIYPLEVTMQLTNTGAVSVTNMQAVFDLDCQQ